MVTAPPAMPARSPAWRQTFQKQFHKTKLCRFNLTGQCRLDKECPFAHGQTDLKAAPDLSKTSICKNWQYGMCRLDKDSCPFAHGDDELRMTPAFTKAPLSKRLQAAIKRQESDPEDADEDYVCAAPRPVPVKPGPVSVGPVPERSTTADSVAKMLSQPDLKLATIFVAMPMNISRPPTPPEFAAPQSMSLPEQVGLLPIAAERAFAATEHQHALLPIAFTTTGQLLAPAPPRGRCEAVGIPLEAGASLPVVLELNGLCGLGKDSDPKKVEAALLNAMPDHYEE